MELGHSVLGNKKEQTTRFVASYVRAGTAGLRNLPTILALLEDDMKVALQAKDNTEAKRLEKLKLQLLDGYNIAMIVGIMQILEKYTRASLVSQNSFYFPTMVWKEIKQNKEEIESPARKWQWEEDPLPISAIGSPNTIIENLKGGSFRPYVPKGARRVPKPTKDDATLNIGQSASESLFDEEEIVECLAGEFSVEKNLSEKEEKTN